MARNPRTVDGYSLICSSKHMADYQRRILIIDDDQTTIKLIQRYLFHPDNLVLTTTSGHHGLQILQEQPGIHVVLVDYMMPDMTGVEFLDKLRKYESRPVVILMSSLTEAQIPSGLRGDRYLKKPVSKTHLLKAIDESIQPPENIEELWKTSSPAGSGDPPGTTQ